MKVSLMSSVHPAWVRTSDCEARAVAAAKKAARRNGDLDECSCRSSRRVYFNCQRLLLDQRLPGFAVPAPTDHV